MVERDDSLSGYGVTTPEAESEPVYNWGPVSDTDVIRLTLPKSGNPPQWVEIKRYLTEEDDAFASDEAMKDGMKMMNRSERRAVKQGKGSNSVTSYFKSGIYRLIVLQRLIKSWSFTTPDGTPIPVTPVSIGKLPSHTRDFIMDTIEEANPRVADFDDDAEEGEGTENPLE